MGAGATHSNTGTGRTCSTHSAATERSFTTRAVSKTGETDSGGESAPNFPTDAGYGSHLRHCRLGDLSFEPHRRDVADESSLSYWVPPLTVATSSVDMPHSVLCQVAVGLKLMPTGARLAPGNLAEVRSQEGHAQVPRRVFTDRQQRNPNQRMGHLRLLHLDVFHATARIWNMGATSRGSWL